MLTGPIRITLAATTAGAESLRLCGGARVAIHRAAAIRGPPTWCWRLRGVFLQRGLRASSRNGKDGSGCRFVHSAEECALRGRVEPGRCGLPADVPLRWKYVTIFSQTDLQAAGG